MNLPFGDAPDIFLDGKVKLFTGDSRNVLACMADNSIDAVVTDGPYALVSIVKRFGEEGAAPAKGNAAYIRASRGFMGKTWDTGETVHDPAFWAEILRVLKPGGHLISFGGTRTYHRMACAVEDAGFEIRDQIQWLYGSGFPKSHNTGDGWGTALKPANEPIVLARKPLSEDTVAANMLRWGTGAINIDGCRVDAGGENPTAARRAGKSPAREAGSWANDRRSAETFAAIRPSESLGRFPANVIHDGSDEVLAAFPNQKPSKPGSGGQFGGNKIYGDFSASIDKKPSIRGHSDDGGSAARFFYNAKANKKDRAGSKHPTVKPVALMRYLCRLVTPPGGTVLDPFAGTGTTGQAALEEGFCAVLIEREEEYSRDIQRRFEVMEKQAKEAAE